MTNDKYQNAVSYLGESSRFRINPSLDNINKFFRRSGLFPASYKTIQVVGTNGKTSTSVILASLLLCLEKFNIGLYLSPHVVHYGERIAINGKSLSSHDFGLRITSFLDEYESLINECSLTEFEIVTAFAHYLFESECVDVAVLEAGLGGRFDATTALNPEMGVFTSLSYDHTDVLGKTLKKIAFEKISHLKNKTVVLAPSLGDKLKIVKTVAKEVGVNAIKSEFNIEDVSISEKGTEFSIFNSFTKKIFPAKVSLIGENYAQNVALACEALSSFSGFRNDNFFEMGSLFNILKTIYIPARFEIKRYHGKRVIIDGAHNPQAVSVTLSVFQKLYGNLQPAVVFSFLKDKNGDEMLKIIKNLTGNIWMVPITTGGERSLSMEEIQSFCSRNLIKYAHSIEAGIEEASSNSDVIMVIGSIYLAGEALVFLENSYNSVDDSLHYFRNFS